MSLGRHQAGALVLIGSSTAQGKSTTARTLVEHMLATVVPNAEVVKVGAIDIDYPNAILARRVSEYESCLRGDSSMSGQIILIDEVRTNRMAFEAVALAQAGLKVIATVHAGASPHQRLSALLTQFGGGETMLSALEAAGQLVMIRQSLRWSTPLKQRIATQERQRGMLRRAGFSGDYLEQLIVQGDNAIFQALLSSEEP